MRKSLSLLTVLWFIIAVIKWIIENEMVGNPTFISYNSCRSNY